MYNREEKFQLSYPVSCQPHQNLPQNGTWTGKMHFDSSAGICKEGRLVIGGNVTTFKMSNKLPLSEGNCKIIVLSLGKN